MEMNPEQLEQQRKQLEDGAPIPPVDASDIQQMWDAARRMPSKPNVAMGLGAYAAYGVEAAFSRPERFMAIWLRQNILAALVGRGVLKDYMDGDQLNAEVFTAAATIPCNKDDLAEATVQLMLSQSPAEVAATAKEEMRAAGYDADKPKIDGKFLDWLRDNC